MILKEKVDVLFGLPKDEGMLPFEDRFLSLEEPSSLDVVLHELIGNCPRKIVVRGVKVVCLIVIYHYVQGYVDSSHGIYFRFFVHRLLLCLVVGVLLPDGHWVINAFWANLFCHVLRRTCHPCFVPIVAYLYCSLWWRMKQEPNFMGLTVVLQAWLFEHFYGLAREPLAGAIPNQKSVQFYWNLEVVP